MAQLSGAKCVILSHHYLNNIITPLDILYKWLFTRKYAILLCVLYMIFVITACSVYIYFSLQNGETALMKAANGEKIDCVDLLLNCGAKVYLQDDVSAVSHSITVCLACSLGI